MFLSTYLLIISLSSGLDAVFHGPYAPRMAAEELSILMCPNPVTLDATFYAPTRIFRTPKTADVIVPLSNGSPNLTNVFTITDSYAGVGYTSVTLPYNTDEAFVEIYASGNSAEEFWYTSTFPL